MVRQAQGYKKTQTRLNPQTGETETYTYWQFVQEVQGQDGKRKRITGSSPNKNQAREALRRNIGKHHRTQTLAQLGEVVIRPRLKKSSSPTVSELIDEWLDGLFPDEVSDIVKRKYRRMADQHLVPHIGEIPADELTPAILKRLFYETLVAKRKVKDGKEINEPLLANSARRNIWKVLNRAFRVAVVNGRLSRNPLTPVKAPKYVRPTDNVPQQAHVAVGLMKRMRADDHDDYARFLFQYLGLRRSERLGLSWANIKGLTTKSAKVVVSQQLARWDNGDGWYIKGKTKTGKARTLPLPEPFLSALRAYKRRQDEWKKSDGWQPASEFADLVFLKPNGSLITPNRDNDDWHLVLASYDYPYWRGHLNRHITATLLADQKPPLPLRVVQEIIGNSEAMTSYYARTTQKQLEEPMEQYGATAFADLMPDE